MTSVDPLSPTVDWTDVRQLVDQVNADIEERTVGGDQPLTVEQQRQVAMDAIGAELQRRTKRALDMGERAPSMEATAALRDAVMAQMFGLGRIAELLKDPRVEDVYIRGTRPVLLKYAGGEIVEHPPVAETDDDLVAQVANIARYQGMNERSITKRDPFLDMNLPGHGARLAFAYTVTPWPIVTIRRHRYLAIGLEELVAMGMISRAMMAYLQAVVMARKSILIVGGQAVGKTFLLRSLAMCLPSHEPFGTLESEYELLLHEDLDRFPLIFPVEAREGSGELDDRGKRAGEITVEDAFPKTLRHSLQRILFGEIRQPREATQAIDSFTRGAPGSMATFHSNSAEEALDRMASLLRRDAPALSHEAALREVAQAVDIVVFIDREVTTEGEIRYVREIKEVTGGLSANGTAISSFIFKSGSATDPRGYAQKMTTEKAPEWMDRAGLDRAWLTRPDLAGWDKPFPERLMGR